MKRSKHPYLWAVLFSILLTGYTAYVLLDAFVIPRRYVVIEQTQTASESGSSADTAEEDDTASDTDKAASEAVVTDTSYSDGDISITITTYRENDTNIYVADITLSSPEDLLTAFADSTYGKNITETTSAIAEASNAILAINGDFYSARDGYVIRNGVIYQDTSEDDAQEDLVIYEDGSMEIIREGDSSAEELLENRAMQVLSFGPGLVEDGQVSVTEEEEVGKAMTSNPRTAIGIIDDLHYVMVVSDGRTEESEGLSLYELAGFMQSELGVTTAYNLDGGGSSTMYFNGEVINQPTTNGNSIRERSVSDIVYIK